MRLPSNVDNITVDDVEDINSKGWAQLSEDKKATLLDHAKRERQTLYSKRMARTPTVDGDPVIFVINLAAHKWQLAEGGHPNSESTQGGSVSYSSTRTDVHSYLRLTEFGETALEHIRDNQGYSMVRTY